MRTLNRWQRKRLEYVASRECWINLHTGKWESPGNWEDAYYLNELEENDLIALAPLKPGMASREAMLTKEGKAAL